MIIPPNAKGRVSADSELHAIKIYHGYGGMAFTDIGVSPQVSLAAIRLKMPAAVHRGIPRIETTP